MVWINQTGRWIKNKDQFEYMELMCSNDGVTMQLNPSYGMATRMKTDAVTTKGSDVTIICNPTNVADTNPSEDLYEYI